MARVFTRSISARDVFAVVILREDPVLGRAHRIAFLVEEMHPTAHVTRSDLAASANRRNRPTGLVRPLVRLGNEHALSKSVVFSTTSFCERAVSMVFL